jgi:hypothetical protein
MDDTETIAPSSTLSHNIGSISSQKALYGLLEQLDKSKAAGQKDDVVDTLTKRIEMNSAAALPQIVKSARLTDNNSTGQIIINGYQAQRKIGHGTYGPVWKARHLTSKQLVIAIIPLISYP